MGSFLGLERINENCGKTTHMETRDRGFTVLPNYFNSINNLLIYRYIL